MRTARIVATLALVALALPAAAVPSFDSGAQAALDKLVTTYAALAAYHGKATMRFATTPADQARPNGTVTYEIKMQRPNKLSIDCTINEVQRKQRILILCDGKRLYAYDSTTRFYTNTAATKEMPNITDLPVNILELTALTATRNPLLDFSPDSAHFRLGPTTSVDLAEVDMIQTASSVPSFDGTQRFTLYVGHRDRLIHGTHLTLVGTDQATKKKISFIGDTSYQLIDTAPKFSVGDFLFIPPTGARPLVSTPPKRRK